MTYLKIVMRIFQGILWAGAMVMGIGNMPSGFGACFLLLALFLTPRCVMDWFWEYWEVRAVLIVTLCYYIVYCLPLPDLDVATYNFNLFLARLRSIW